LYRNYLPDPAFWLLGTDDSSKVTIVNEMGIAGQPQGSIICLPRTGDAILEAWVLQKIYILGYY
jgi:hypothetical protein